MSWDKFTNEMLCLAVALSIVLRWSVGTFPYSGKGKPPMYGDYEAQRHWQEITVNLPVDQWYTNSSDNDLLYWGLDYPPLTAYHSWLVGKVAENVNSSWVALFKSRGIESYHHQLFMRYSVLCSDLALYYPSVILYASSYAENIRHQMLMGLFFYSGIILIDYGHFQYNCVSLGLFILAVALLEKGRVLFGAAAFSLALNYKQMELYHAIPFFLFILGSSLQASSLVQRLLKVATVGLIVIATFGICWFPYLRNVDKSLDVLQRLFPFSRGLFEDKVSNFWCSLNVVFKIRNWLSQPNIVTLCAVTTLLSILPSSAKLLLQPTSRNFKYSLVISSLAFFLFSYHVHEKSILIVAISSLLIVSEDPLVTLWFSVVSTFSMLPLLIKDELVMAAVGATLIYSLLMYHTFCSQLQQAHRSLRITVYLSAVGMVILTLCSLYITPPQRLPDLWPVLVSLYSCAHFGIYYLYLHWKLLAPKAQD